MKRELELLRVKMKETGVDACLIPTSDFHGSEYVGDYFKCREYISGFTVFAGSKTVIWFWYHFDERTSARSSFNRGIFKDNIKER